MLLVLDNRDLINFLIRARNFGLVKIQSEREVLEDLNGMLKGNLNFKRGLKDLNMKDITSEIVDLAVEDVKV